MLQQLKASEINSTRQEEWNVLFNDNPLRTVIHSTSFVKKLTVLTFSTITYLRGIFPENAFDDRELEGRQVKLLKGYSKCERAYLMSKWILSAFKAIENKYMKEFILEIRSNDNKLLEFYKLEYIYTDEETMMTFSQGSQRSKDEVLKVENSTFQLMRALFKFTDGLGLLPKKYTIQLRINYHEEVTPEDYTPKYFTLCDSDDNDEINRETIYIESVQTKYHSISLSAGSLTYGSNSDSPGEMVIQRAKDKRVNLNKAFIRNTSSDDSRLLEVFDSSRGVTKTSLDSDSFHLRAANDLRKRSASSSMPDHSITVDKTNQNDSGSKSDSSKLMKFTDDTNWETDRPLHNVKNELVTRSKSPEALNDSATKETSYFSNLMVPHLTPEVTYNCDESQPMGEMGFLFNSTLNVSCICGYDFGRINIFECSQCDLWHHFVCYGMIPGSRYNPEYACFKCAYENPQLTCIDSRLALFSYEEAKFQAQYRQVLMYINSHKFMFTAKEVSENLGLPLDATKDFIDKIKKEKLIRSKSSAPGTYIKNKALSDFLTTYMKY